VIADDYRHGEYMLIEARVTLEAPEGLQRGRVDSQTTAHTAHHSAFSIEPYSRALPPRIECALWCAVRCGWLCMSPPPLTVPSDLLTLPAEALHCGRNPPLVGSSDPRHLDVERVTGYKTDRGLVDLP
jgi:hypothetical protein